MKKNKDMCEKTRLNKQKSAEDKDALLGQWQTCVEMANAVSQRRDAMNNLFVTLNLAIIAAVSLIWNTKTVALLVSGIIVCAVWIFFIRNFRELNKAKFEVINKLEQCLPVSAFSDEWQSLKKSRKYIEGTKLEKLLPFTFCILYIGIFILIIFQGCNKASINQP